MGYQAGGTDYHLDTRQRALDKTTEAKKREAESARERRIRQSGQRSDAQKILSAPARGAAAYFTGGASETFGGGEMIDAAMLGTDSEGRAVRNEYGDLVGMASQIGGAMSAKKAGDAALQLQNQAKADQAMLARLDTLDPSGKLGMDMALKIEAKNKRNTEALQKHKGGFMGLLNKDVEGLDLKPTTMGDWEAVLAKAEAPKPETPKPETIDPSQAFKGESNRAYNSAMPKGETNELNNKVINLEKKALEDKKKMRENLENLKGTGLARPALTDQYKIHHGR